MAIVNVTIFPAHLQTILSKLVQKCSTVSPTSPYYNMTAAQLEPLVWERVKEELSKHCQRMHQDSLHEFAFVYNVPLGDTVFMFTEVSIPPGQKYISFDVTQHPGGTNFMVDFYARV